MHTIHVYLYFMNILSYTQLLYSFHTWKLIFLKNQLYCLQMWFFMLTLLAMRSNILDNISMRGEEHLDNIWVLLKLFLQPQIFIIKKWLKRYTLCILFPPPHKGEMKKSIFLCSRHNCYNNCPFEKWMMPMPVLIWIHPKAVIYINHNSFNEVIV